MTYTEGIEEDGIPVIEFAPVPEGTDFDKKVLAFCYYRAHKVSEIAQYLGVRDSTYLRKKVLENLVQNGYLEKSRVSRAMYYKTKRGCVSVK